MYGKYIGNVVVSSKSYKVDDCFKKCEDISEIDASLPTIVLGLEKAKCYIADFNILVRKYNDGMLWWTFLKTERRADNEKDCEEFYRFCVDNIINKIKYKNINIINLTFHDLRVYMELMNNNNIKKYYIDNDKALFIYDICSDTVYGISLNTCSFFGIDKRKVVDFVRSNPYNIQIRNFYDIPSNVRRFINEDVIEKMVLVDYFLQKTDYLYKK